MGLSKQDAVSGHSHGRASAFVSAVTEMTKFYLQIRIVCMVDVIQLDE